MRNLITYYIYNISSKYNIMEQVKDVSKRRKFYFFSRLFFLFCSNFKLHIYRQNICTTTLFQKFTTNKTMKFDIRHFTQAADPTRKLNYFYYVIVYTYAPVSFLVRGSGRTITFNIIPFSINQILVINDLMTKQFQKRINFYL